MSNYEFSLRQEVLLEKGADILGSLFHFARNNHISPSDKKIQLMLFTVWYGTPRAASWVRILRPNWIRSKRSLILLVNFTLVLRREQNGHPVISGITIWDRTPTKIYDSCGTAECPSEVLRQYWNRPWPDEELQDMQRSILRLRLKEEACQLKQSPSIDELERRVQEAAIGPGLTFNTMM